ncbi:hypothetical protein DUNSADRAFT_2736 [Dunaliella salina]|uniref:Encoded protein n=1 Tax=Dunaliella salina TaxID=3046 RepID=A0ABQ7FW23_DUNSA|nr:hypothetical protein DUNSADRAFT_2736 [Dunaliella salina]|eukprot:KAF5826570.1 hypothetical protein DUNSADRAFT_2736 [Dunaliella salina]
MVLSTSVHHPHTYYCYCLTCLYLLKKLKYLHMFWTKNCRIMCVPMRFKTLDWTCTDLQVVQLCSLVSPDALA